MPLLTPGAARFKPLALFKQGRYNVVSLVLDLSDQKERVARLIKLPPGASEVALLEGIERAARMLKTLDHPNLPRFDKVVEGSGGTWLFFKYVEAAPLSNYAGVQKTVPDTWVLWWLAEMLKALQALHQNQPPVVVGYLEPADVLVSDHRLILADLGLFEDLFPEIAASMLSRHPQVNFIAPERRMASQTHPTADVFSAAAISYWLLTGDAPVVSGPKSSDPIRAALKAARPQLADAAAELLTASLSFYPSQRPATAGAMLEQVTPLLTDMTGKKPPAAASSAPSVQRVARTTSEMLATKPELSAELPAGEEMTADSETTAVDENETPPAVSPLMEFLEDLLWQLRSHPILVTMAVVILVLTGAVWLQKALRPVLPKAPPVMQVASGQVMAKVPHPAVGEPLWVPIHDIPDGTVITAVKAAVLSFDHDSTLGMSPNAELDSMGRDHEALALKVAHGVLDIRTSRLDQLALHLPPGNLLVFSGASEAEVDLTERQQRPTLVIKMQHGQGTLSVGESTVALTSNMTVQLSADGKKIVH